MAVASVVSIAGTIPDATETATNKGGTTTVYINRLLLLVTGIVLIFFPAIESWMIDSATAWYRPYQIWLLIVIAAYWNQRTRYPDEL